MVKSVDPGDIRLTVKEADDHMIEDAHLIEDTISLQLKSGVPHKIQLKSKADIDT